ncbi:aspartate aminotransferase family protein [Virgibacillus sp. W0181]|uniref:aspartate aminotransferase family protein n=1 Tax=Virgibacillus sp. W0181 TaxID=3391581 RepID=UPI003F48437B
MERSHLIKPILDVDYPVATYGKGIYLYDQEGKKYLDGSSGAVTASIGHGVTEVVEAMKEQADKVSFVYRSQFANNPAEKLAKKLSEITPGDLNWSFFVNSGSEATETAMKIAIQYWQEKGKYTKNKIISRWMSYHGITLAALSMSGYNERRERFTQILEQYPTVSAPYEYRQPRNESGLSANEFYAEELEREIHRLGKDHVAAFIAEPIVGAAGGALTPSDGYYQAIKEVCERNDILFIADEVMTGMGRTGKMFAIEHWAPVIPDLITTGKGMTGGYTPMAAALVSDRIMDPILKGSKLIMSGHTFSANPQSAAVSLAVLNYMEKHQLVRNSAENGVYLFSKIEGLAASSKIIGDVRGKGLFVGIEFVADKRTKEPFDREIQLTNTIVKQAFENGLLVYPAAAGVNGINGSAIIIAPPLIITKAEIDELILQLDKTFMEVEQKLIDKGHLNMDGKVKMQ